MTAPGRPAHEPAWDPLPPVPFTAVDELCCYFDSAAEPNNVHLEVRVPGHLDYPRLRAATARALAAAPRARGVRAPGSPLRASYTWQFPRQPDIEPVSGSTWSDEDELARIRLAFLAAAPRLDCSPPVRLLLAAGPETDCLILNAHHAAFDGISCLQLLRAIGRQYSDADADPGAPAAPAGEAAAAWPGPAAPAWPGPAAPASPGPAAPASPGPAAAAWPGPAAAAASRSGPAPRGRWHQRLRPGLPARIAADPGDRPPGRGRPGRRRDGYGIHLLTLSDGPAVPAGAGRSATLNDLLIAALILAIGRWNSAHGRRARQIRVSMPINARRGPDQQSAAGNLSRIETVCARPPRGAAEIGELVFEVAAQTRSAKQKAGPQVGIASRWLAMTRCPVWLKRMITRAVLRTIGPLQCDTAMLTNLGNVAEPPGFGPGHQPVAMAFTAPAHMPRGLSVGAVTADGQLQLCLRYRYALLGDLAAGQFAASYVAALAELSGQGQEQDQDQDQRQGLPAAAGQRRMPLAVPMRQARPWRRSWS